MTEPSEAFPGKARRARPRNRREQILIAATDLFHRRGFTHVSLSDIADEVGVGSSALYRHYPSKSALLVAATARQLSVFDEVVASSPDPVSETTLSRLAATAIDNRQVGVLWQRECRRLEPEQRCEPRALLHKIVETFVGGVRRRRPDTSEAHTELLGWSCLAVLHSISYHGIEVPRPDFDAILTDMLQAVCQMNLAESDEVGLPDRRSGIAMRSRREAILRAATALFAQNSYAAVSIEDIGEAVGIAGPSVYNYFSSKADILLAAMTRGTETLRAEMAAAFAAADGQQDGLRRLAASYVEFVMAHSELIDVLIGELIHLPPEQREIIRAAQREYIDEWIHLVTALDDTMDQREARLRVQASLTVVNDISRTPNLRRLPRLDRLLTDITLVVLHA